MLIDTKGAEVRAPTSGYLQFVAYTTLVDIASRANSMIRFLHRPGHFVVEGLPLTRVWPSESAQAVTRALEQSHATGAHRTLSQDLSFTIDQMVEIAICALSPRRERHHHGADVYRLVGGMVLQDLQPLESTPGSP